MEQEFSEELFQCMEAVRENGSVNMFGGRDVAYVAEMVCDPEQADELDRLTAVPRRGYGKLLAAFALWKRSQAVAS